MCIGSGNSGFPFSHRNPAGMEINVVVLGTGTGTVTRKWETMGIGKCDKIPEEHNAHI